MLKKVGILTFHRAKNYGAVLQAYALQKAFEAHGSQAELVDYVCGIYDHYNIFLPDFGIMKRASKVVLQRNVLKKNKKFDEFLSKKCRLSTSAYFPDMLAASGLENQYDYFVTGSDQVWNPNIVGKDEAFFLKFIRANKKKISYAASIGLPEIPDDLSDWYKNTLNTFCKISVREKSAVDSLEKLGPFKPELVADPTFLLSAADWRKIEKEVKTPPEYILIYAFGTADELWYCARKLSKKTGIKICVITDSIKPIKDATVLRGVGPEQWLYLIDHAAYIFTNSFHGMVLSMVFRKNFWISSPRDNTDSRLLDLLKMLNCDERVIRIPSAVSVEQPVDYIKAEKMMDEYIKVSHAFIENVIADKDYSSNFRQLLNTTCRQENVNQFSLNCYGCTACSVVCPKSAISMCEDAKGSLFPYVDAAKCVNCGICVGVCPVNAEHRSVQFEQHFYAAKNRKSDERQISSSGGIFILMAKAVVLSSGVVYGVCFENGSKVIYARVTEGNEVNILCGSKYVECPKGDMFEKVKRDLREGKTVLFSGTPCTIAGLKNIVGDTAGKLITTDIICHGVPVPALYNEYLDFYRKKYSSAIKSINFRDKVYNDKLGYAPPQKIKMCFDNGEVYNGFSEKDPFYLLYWSGNILRESCYQCRFATLERCSDFTLGDYWGNTERAPGFFTDKSISTVIVNSPAGADLFNRIKGDMDLLEVTKDECMQRNLHMPTPKGKSYNAFWYDYWARGFRYILFRYADYYGLIKFLSKCKGWLKHGK